MQNIEILCKSGEWGLSVVIFFETFNLFDVIDVMFNFLELWESFSWDNVAEVFFELHGQFDGIKRVKPVIGKGAFASYAWVRLKVPFL